GWGAGALARRWVRGAGGEGRAVVPARAVVGGVVFEGFSPARTGAAQRRAAGEVPWSKIAPTIVDAVTIERTSPPARLTEPFVKAPVVLVVCVDLKVVASMDQLLTRVGVISGASIYPFAWNILMAARHEGYGGTITTLAVAQE